MTQHPQQEYIATEEQLQIIEKILGYNSQAIHDIRSRPTPAPAAPEIVYRCCEHYSHPTEDNPESCKYAATIRSQTLDDVLKRLERQGVEIHERNGQRYYVVEGTFNFASFMQWLESLRTPESERGDQQ